MRRGVTGILLLLIVLISSATAAWSSDQDQGWNSFGVRAGVSATRRDAFFHQYEGFASYGLPWSIRNKAGWGVAMQLNGAVGALHAAGETGLIAAIGPGIIIDKAGGAGIALEIGGDVNGLSRYRFGDVDLNGHVLWDGHIGVLYRFAAGPGLGYRFQHTSNGGLNGKRNTGFDMHMVSLSWNWP